MKDYWLVHFHPCGDVLDDYIGHNKMRAMAAFTAATTDEEGYGGWKLYEGDADCGGYEDADCIESFEFPEEE